MDTDDSGNIICNYHTISIQFIHIFTALLNSEVEKRISDAFLIFDHHGNKSVDVREIGTILRYLGNIFKTIYSQKCLLVSNFSRLCTN